MMRVALAILVVAACSGTTKPDPTTGTTAGSGVYGKKLVVSWGIQQQASPADVFLQTTDETGKQTSYPLGSFGGHDSCAALGILAPVAGVIGALQAQLALRLLETAMAAAGLLYVYEMRGRRWRTLRFERDPQCSTCSAAAQHAA